MCSYRFLSKSPYQDLHDGDIGRVFALGSSNPRVLGSNPIGDSYLIQFNLTPGIIARHYREIVPALAP